MDNTIFEMMQDKSNKFKFLLAIQNQEYDEAYQLGKQILTENPYDKCKIKDIVRHILKFYVYGLFDFNEEEDDDYEDEEEEDEEEDEEDEEEEDEEEEEENEVIEQTADQEDSDYEWVYEDEEEQEGFDDGQNEQNEDEIIKQDNNEGDISFVMDQQIKQVQQQQNSIPKQINQINKPKSSIQNTIPILPKIKQKSRPNSQQKQSKPLQNKQASVNQLRFPSSLVKKK